MEKIAFECVYNFNSLRPQMGFEIAKRYMKPANSGFNFNVEKETISLSMPKKIILTTA